MERKVTLLRPERINEIRSKAGEAEKIDEAILTALETHATPLTFNDIRSLMPEKFVHWKKVSSALKRLIRQGKVQKVIVLMPERPVVAYALITDSRTLVGIPVNLFREEGHEVLMGFVDEDRKESYDLYKVNADWIMIHIDPVERKRRPGNELRASHAKFRRRNSEPRDRVLTCQRL